MSEIREHFIHNRAPPNPAPQTDRLLGGFFCSGYYRHGWGQRYLHATARRVFNVPHQTTVHDASLHIHIHESTGQLGYH